MDKSDSSRMPRRRPAQIAKEGPRPAAPPLLGENAKREADQEERAQEDPLPKVQVLDADLADVAPKA